MAALFFAEASQFEGEQVTLRGTDAHHIRNVLRMKPGEEILVSDGAGRNCRAEIREIGEESVICRILEEDKNRELPSRIFVFQCLPKGDKMETVIQKCVELGAAGIVPVSSRYCVVKLEGKKAEGKVSRWNAIAKSAAEQSKRSLVPEVTEVKSFREALAYAASFPRKALLYENAEGMKATRDFVENLKPGEDIAVLVGPEGGFSPEEAEEAEMAGFISLSLGRRILRTETAGMAFCAVLSYTLEEKG